MEYEDLCTISDGEFFELTNRLRWVVRDSEKILQQLQKGNFGNRNWVDVPIEIE